MDEIWVPTTFHLETFMKSGVNRSKLFVVPEPVDVNFFDPERVTPLELERLIHVHERVQLKPKSFKFLSIFKVSFLIPLMCIHTLTFHFCLILLSEYLLL
jgi:hypothetical protein